MKLKKWNDYSNLEKQTLLKHWWLYYGKLLITAQEDHHFNQLVEKYPNTMMDVALFAYLLGESSQTLIAAMRQNRIKELLKTIDVSMEELRLGENFCVIEEQFLSMLVESYNYPTPSIPMSKEEMDRQVRDMGKDPEKVIYIDKSKF